MQPPSSVPLIRITADGDSPVAADGAFVLYWMTAFRRLTWNYALDRAIDWASHLGKPLVVVEVLCCGRRWDSDRTHRFVLEGMAGHAEQSASRAVLYYPLVETKPGSADALLAALSQSACVVIADDYPGENPAAPAGRLPVRLERIDGNCLMPLCVAEHAMPTAFAYRRFSQKNFREYGLDAPSSDPLTRLRLPLLKGLGEEIRKRFPPATAALLAGRPKALAALKIDHAVAPVDVQGGSQPAHSLLHRFLKDRLARYHLDRNEPDLAATSELSPYLHHGHIGAHEVFHAIVRYESWDPGKLAERNAGRREGWWGMGEGPEAFLDQLATWREVGYNMCRFRDDYDRYDSLPAWAQTTLKKHADDPRPYVYTLAQFEVAETHDPLWNAAQRQLLREGAIHNYLRMLWGKKILEWTATPQDALAVMIELNNKYAMDGRDPNSYSGIFWTLGRYDRPWGPERPIFGTIRYMTSENTARKHGVKNYLAQYGA